MDATNQVTVIGGGICGLAVAHRLGRAGVRVTLLESSDQLGGLGTFFPMGDRWVERFYHCVMPSDTHLLRLLGELDPGQDVAWRNTRMGMIVDGARYPFNTARDLLRFAPLPLPHRVRLGVASLLLRRLGRGKDLDNIRTEDWLRGLYGDTVWERLLAPMFGSKFGPSCGDVPALYLWQRLGRESNVATRGYPVGGYKTVIDRLQASIEATGGTVRVNTPVLALRHTGTGMEIALPNGETIETDRVVSTVPLPLLRTLADDDLSARLPTTQLTYQGVVNALFFLRRPLSGQYWAPVLHSNTEFDGVVEMSALSGPETYGGRHLAYAMRYTDRESPLYREDESTIAQRWTNQLLRLYADLPLTTEDIVEVRIFKAPFVEPVYPLGYLTQRPAIEVPNTPLLLATTAHVYPEVTSWNSSVGLAERVAITLLTSMNHTPTTTKT
ncbi:NAD(P)/FAD-dependent oxidoreductase [Actinokineospora iranica]|uniref:Protoporphyrinogen oxidase n=1 Tax=Actinokineospora iranica TaxID=1271860 RepID=A0A1G6XFG1_9PSEU|nr:NAD(P)/FAD-dependent oxidoreductase [Actinokineospora iranica]SDD76065.1 Protoporphyrinogen oxidase [Actinokineospora iranica]